MGGQPNTNITSLELRSEITSTGQLRLSLEEQDVAPPGPDEVVVRVEAAPINPDDLAELLGPADVATLTSEGTAERPVTNPIALFHSQRRVRVSPWPSAWRGRVSSLTLEPRPNICSERS